MQAEYVYVASSWANPIQIAVVAGIKAAGIGCYDFKDEDGFHWSEVVPPEARSYQKHVSVIQEDVYLKALEHPRAKEGFKRDMDALRKASHVVCVLPCGRSAHLELGWACERKPTAVLLDGPTVTPELMYLMVDYLAPSLFDLLGWLGVED